MKLKNILIVVDDIEKSKAFYKDLFGLFVITDFGENVILSEGLVLQERKLWEQFINRTVEPGGCDTELYFEENDMEAFVRRLAGSEHEIRYVNEMMEHSWGKRVIRIYDPDKHIIEIGESPDFVIRRLLQSGMTEKEVAAKTQLPVERVKEYCDK